jgi:hypothetical protein
MHHKGLNRDSRMISEGKSTETVIHEFFESIQEATEKKDKPNWNFLWFITHHTMC